MRCKPTQFVRGLMPHACFEKFEPSSTDAAGVTSVCFGSRLDIFTLVRSTFDTSIQVVEGLDIAIAAAVFGYLVRFR